MTDELTYDDDAVLAGEYVLRLLAPDDHAAFEARLVDEPDLVLLVEFWEAHFAGLAEDVADVAPSPAVRQRVLGRFADAPARGGFWGWLAGGLATAVAVGVAAIWLTATPPFEPELHADLFDADGALVLAAGYDEDTGVFRVIPSATPAPGRALELWLIAEGAAAPVSLGLVPEGQRDVVLPPDVGAALEGGTLAVSDEPPGGSPTGAPTGEVLAAAALFEV